MAEAPAFDPTKPFDVVGAPPFDPSKPYEEVSGPAAHKPASMWDFVPSEDLPSGGLVPGRYYDPMERQIAKVSPYVANIMAAFGEGAGAAFQERLGLSDESHKFLERAGIFHNPTDDPNIFKSINEGVIGPLAMALDATKRYAGAIYGGMQAAAVEAGVNRDIVSIPDAWAGSPHPFGIPEPPAAKVWREHGVLPPEVVQSTEFAEKAKEPVGFVVWHGSGANFDAFDFSKIGTGEGAQAYGHGGYFGGARGIGEYYQSVLGGVKLLDREGNEVPLTRDDLGAAKRVVEYGGDLDKAIEDLRPKAEKSGFFKRELETVERWKEEGKQAQSGGMLYRVRVNADPEQFYDLDKPLAEQTDYVRDAMSKALGDAYPDLEWKTGKGGDLRLVKAGAEDTSGSWGNIIKVPEGYSAQSDAFSEVFPTLEAAKTAVENYSHNTFIRMHMTMPETRVAAAASMRDAGLPGIKYLDQDSRLEGTGTRNYVVFDDQAVQITHKNDVPVDLADARALGVIGPEPAARPEAPPAETAHAATADPMREPPSGGGGTGGPGEPTGGGPAGGPASTNPWRERFEHFVGKLDAPDDVKALIRKAADENGEFLPARQGDIPLRHVTAIADAAGVDPSEINVRGLGRNLKNDAEVRVAMQMMLQVTDDVRAAAREVRADASPENLIKMQEAIMRRDLAVEQIVGLRAEWGRTGNVFQEFLREVKDQETLSEFMKAKGRNPQDLKDIANAVDAIDRDGAAKMLNELRGKETGPIYWYWVNSLISGILTHTKYVAANAFYAGTERGITTPIAAIIGKARELAGIGSDVDRVFFGEGMAATYGMLAATPTSLMAAARSIRAGQRVPLKSEIELRNAMIARGEKVPASMELSVNPVTGAAARPIGGILGRVIGLPGDVASGIHTFFKIAGERAGIEAEAYHKAAAEGLDPTDTQFWVRRAELAANPTEEMRQKAVEEAYKSTFMQELGPHGKAFQRFTKQIPGLKWLFPFTHIPINLMKATYEYTPAAILDSDMRSALMGDKGQRAQDMAIARMAAGSTLMAWFTHQALSGRATGDMPRDQKERDAWKLEGKQPNSILIGDHWVSFSKFGPAGDLANIGANLGSVVQVLREGDDDAMEKATWRAAEAAGRLIIDEVGFQSLNNLVEAIADPDRFGSRWVGSQAATFLPYSSFLTQTASVIDPAMREAKTITDSLKYRIPVVRETLLPKRDWTGALVDNPQYGNIIRQRQVNVNAVDMEAELLGIHAAPPANRVGTVKLTPRMYDEYQVTAGTLTRQALEQMIRQPNWYDMPVFAREEVFKKTITASRQQAAAIIQMRHPEIIQQGLENIRNRIEGNKATKLKDAQ